MSVATARERGGRASGRGEVTHREQRQQAGVAACSVTPRSMSVATARERGGRASGRGEVTHREQLQQAGVAAAKQCSRCGVEGVHDGRFVVVGLFA